ncbi:hypothetical protein Vadar_034588 [Vaccinium darrowii]|uniref:Uncharacterized protein n=1 Tax=Vaccinium darrowii TaxID=229202 RepID=A0ACB7Y3V9_9ERIC|nr:hypothetical protein Vadar_034588 [Vaccinium darrowii]
MAESLHRDSWSEGSRHVQGVQRIPSKTQNASLKVFLLHGNLDIWVKEAKNLPNMLDFHRDTLQKSSGKVSSKSQGKVPHNGRTSDPYVTIAVSGSVIGRTFVISNSENPVWKQHFWVPVAHSAAEVHFVVKDNDVVGSEIIGVVGIPVEQLWSATKIDGTFPIIKESGKPWEIGAVLSLSIQYIPMGKMTLCNSGVPGTYFPLRKGGRVMLYQDAHVHDGFLPNLRLDHDMQYKHGNCWRDIFDAITQARKLIYITGWSVYHQVRLVRGNDKSAEVTLGDLLKTKSQEGVRVLLLVWDDPTSFSFLSGIKGGVMHTSDEEIQKFFKHSSVKALLCPRSSCPNGHSRIKKLEAEKIYTHHQKTVIVDADAGQDKRKIIAFVGGLDLCKGRYDTPNHSIFSTLQTVHEDDYYNPSFKAPVVGCPREPWHDLHCRIDGPASYDILTNFEERWAMASKPRRHEKLKMTGGDALDKISKIRGITELKSLSPKKILETYKSYDDAVHDDALLTIDSIPDIIRMTDLPSLRDGDPEAWNVQVFRSIDSNSVKGFPENPKDATSKNLVCGKNVLIDMSIHTAYVNAIRAAQRFIYIENQYFLGSSYNWNNHKNLGANNLIPMEIALKIAQKIKANERFSVYIVIPMWPEGVPTNGTIQRILFWQYNTMQMMYEVIYKALEEEGLENNYEPQDYLNFFCLGNREAEYRQETTLDARNANAKNTPQELTRKNRRFMIYVHSKGMIVDDEYVILGSANINQRSLEGTRDTEIAMGAYQPRHTWADKQCPPHGQIYGYRMSLWAEHIGGLEECFQQPESIECARRVRTLGEENWKQFVADEVTEMKGHLLKYPLEVDRMGKVNPLPGCKEFPDMGGKITGSIGLIDVNENLTI